jgi:hypothetical protein
MISFADGEHQIQGVAIAAAGTLLKVEHALTQQPPPTLSGDGSALTLRAGEGCELVLTALHCAEGPAADQPVTLHRAAGTVGSRDFAGLALVRRECPANAAVSIERSIDILFDATLAFSLRARRTTGAGGHGDEEIAAVVFRGEPLELVAIEKPRLSSTYDAEGRLRHAGLELWESEEAELALRIGGEVLGSGELAGGDGAPTQVAFVAWHQNGRRGLGSYTITREL